MNVLNPRVVTLSALMFTHLIAEGASIAPLFHDPLDGSGPAADAAITAWQRAPDISGFVPAPDGHRALRYERGATWDAATQPWAGESSWSNYRIEVDVLPETMWAGLDFCVADDGGSACNLTMFHGEDDRLTFEFAGIHGAAASWKVYPIGQRHPLHTPGAWVHLRVDVGTSCVNVHVDDDPEPAATFFDLPRTAGGVRLMTYYGSALFRNLRITQLTPDDVIPVLDDPWAFARATDRGVLRDWQVSPRHDVGWGADGLPADVTDGPVAWRRVQPDGRGVLDLTASAQPDNEKGSVFARTTLHADAPGTRTLRLTYTDDFALWCNGEKVFTGPSRQWFSPDREKHGNSRLIPDQYEVVVPVRAGSNDLLVRSETTERFGWAFWVRVVESAPSAVDSPME